MQIPLFKLLTQAFLFLSAIIFRKIFHVQRKALDPHSAKLSFPNIQSSYASTWCHYLPGCPRQTFTSLSLFSACPLPPVCSKSARMVNLPTKIYILNLSTLISWMMTHSVCSSPRSMSHGLSVPWLSNYFFFGSALWHLSSPARDWNWTLAVRAPSPNHWTSIAPGSSLASLVSFLTPVRPDPLCLGHCPFKR